ncbi:protein Lilipod isoform X2 [Microplitis demolitor]|uniref:protein Lilipod isoform X2 n=1 Tax=Microplitis demolitor TaxID=69319 RepID=UPI0006D4CAC6|nr:protein Lilipod isoform X2 [Microplitis demolitor]
MDVDADVRAQSFHNTVRENIIFLLLYFLLYISSYLLIAKCYRKDRDFYCTVDEDEATVHKISIWLCTAVLAVSLGATLLLPVSIISNEILIIYPDSHYVQWLNSSLIQGLWNHVFLFSNLSLFVFLPFAYFFTESEGFVGNKKGVMSRVYETVVVLCLIGILILGLAYVLLGLTDYYESSFFTMLNLWRYYVLFMYSCVSFVGVLILLVCTPLGFVRLFEVVGSLLVKPQFLRNLDDEFLAYKLEEDSIRRRLHSHESRDDVHTQSISMLPPIYDTLFDDEEQCINKTSTSTFFETRILKQNLVERLIKIQFQLQVLDQQRKTWWVRRTLLYPFAILALFFLSTTTALLAFQNTLELLIGIKALPLITRQFTLGISSLSKLGPIGAVVEVIVIFYVAITSTVGLYGLPGVNKIMPQPRGTPLTHLIANCVLLLIHSSALPLLSRILGMTNFDLLGDFGHIEWLGNFRLLLLYNFIFVISVISCLTSKFTTIVRNELYNKLRSSFRGVFGQQYKESIRMPFSVKNK